MVHELKTDPRTADVGEARRTLLDYVITLTEKPWECSEEQIRSMRVQGYSDQAICAANQITGFFAWCNRTIDGLGVPMEEYGPTP